MLTVVIVANRIITISINVKYPAIQNGGVVFIRLTGLFYRNIVCSVKVFFNAP